jgi:hypothetical protein
MSTNQPKNLSKSLIFGFTSCYFVFFVAEMRFSGLICPYQVETKVDLLNRNGYHLSKSDVLVFCGIC